MRKPMPSAEEIGANVFATAQQIARGLFLLGGNVDGGERARAIQHGELAGIATIRLDAIAWSARNQRGRDDIARDPVSGQRALEFEATGPGFVAALNGPGASHALDEAEDCRDIGDQLMNGWRPLARQ
jgi:hypothetical protein